MLEYLPKDLREGLEVAHRRANRQRARLRLQIGDAVFPVRRLWQDGLALEAALAPRALRGLVDIHDGGRHVFQCLIVASEIEEGELICSFKRLTAVTTRAPLDYWQDESRPAGYLPAR